MGEEINTKLEKGADTPTFQPIGDHKGQDEIEDTLARFKVIRSSYLQRVFNALPPVILVGSIAFILFLRHIQDTSWGLVFIFAGGASASIVSILVTKNLFNRFPDTLLILWRRKLLKLRSVEKSAPRQSATKVSAQFQRFTALSEQRLNGKTSMAFGFIVLLVAFWLGGQFRILSASEWAVALRSDPLVPSIGLLVFLLYYAFAFIVGLFVWRIAVIAWRIRQLGIEFDFNLQVEHPDGCGGLRGIGDLCLMLAYILSPFLLLGGGWLTLTNLTGQTYWNISASTAQAFLISMIVLSLICFFQPLTAIHAAMNRSKLELQKDLDLISQQIHQLGVELMANAERLSAEEGAKMEKKIDFLRRVYDRNSKIPAWPIRYDHLWRLATTQIAPVIGLGTSGIGLVKGFKDLF